MNLGLITLGALALAVILSCTTSLNVGLLSIALAWFIGVYLGHMPLKEITGGFPVDLFLTLAGVTLLFSQARVNGTLERVAHLAVRLCRGRVGIVPIMYFFLASDLATAGPGNIATTGLLAPMAMTTAMGMGISPFLMAIMVGNGANSGSLSPLAPTGIIVSGLMNRIDLPGLGFQTWFFNFIAHAIVAFAGYFIFGGWKLIRRAERFKGTGEHAPGVGPKARAHHCDDWLSSDRAYWNLNIGLACFLEDRISEWRRLRQQSYWDCLVRRIRKKPSRKCRGDRS